MKAKRGACCVPGERYVLCPTAFGTMDLLLLCMLAVSVSLWDKVVSWEIKSGPANEKHAKAFASKPSPFNSSFFIIKYTILSMILLHYQAPLLSWYLYEQAHCFIMSDLSPATVIRTICMNGSQITPKKKKPTKTKQNKSNTWLLWTDLLKHPAGA